ncbi:MAG: ankyrin repeat domain-containing protein [Chlamydiia bacterium]
MAVKVGSENNFYGYLQFPTYQDLSEKVARVANVVKKIASTVFSYCMGFYTIFRFKVADRDTYAPLMLQASEKGVGDLVKWVLHFAKIGDSFVTEALHKAVEFGHPEVVKIIFQDIRANRLDTIDRQRFFDRTLFDALCKAVEFGHLEVVKIIFQNIREDKRLHKLDTTERKQLFDHALICWHPEVFKFILEELDPDRKNWANLLRNYVENGDLEAFKALIEGCCERKNDLYRVPYICGLLITAAIEGYTSIVEYALNHVELSLKDCKFALECAASFRHVEIMDKLLPRTGAQATDYFLPGSNREGNWREAAMVLTPRTSQGNARSIQQIWFKD